MKHIYTHENIAVLHSVKNVLGLNDIESFVKNEHVVSMSARHGIENMFHQLWILNDADYNKASLIIENEIKNPTPKAAWICAKCNEENDGNFEICWRCQNTPSKE